MNPSPTPQSPACPKCGAALPADAPEALCPACLLSAAVPTQAPTVASGERMKPVPTPAELAANFPGLEILELIGRGGMGAVYKARQKNLNRFVALKILPGDAGNDPHFAERFQREAQALARLNHPNIVSVFDFGRAGDVFYFLMEYVDGTNLRSLIRAGKMQPAEALALIPGICDALQYAHDEGVVHRDIKPENVLVDRRGRVKIADFGLAKLLGLESADHTLTMSGMTLGTPRYMAPEQLEKPELVDHRADIYSLGVVFYELLTGELPMGRFDPPSKKVEVDVRLDEIVLRSLERDMQRRYQHASEVRDDVEQMKSTPAVAVAAKSEAPPASAAESSNSAVKPVLIACGIITIVSGILTALLLAGVFVDRYHFDTFFRSDAVTIPLLIMQTLAIPVGVLMILGGLAARRPHSRLARAAANLGFIPLTPGWLLTMPLSIFALKELGPDNMAEEARMRRQLARSQVPGQPILNRGAVAGALWSIFGFLTILPVLFFIGMDRVWRGTAEPTDAIHTSAPVGFIILMGILLVIGAGSLIGTPILGFVGLSVIKNSPATQRGLRLAMYDILVFPTALLAAAIVAGLAILIRGLPEALVLGIPTAFFVSRHFVRKWWFALSGKPRPVADPVSKDGANLSVAQSRSGPLSTRWLQALLWIVLLAGAVIFLTFEEKTVFQQTPVQTAQTTVTIGAFDPWFTATQGREIRVNFLTKSALAGALAMIAGILLAKSRRAAGEAKISAEAWLLAAAGLTFLISVGWAIRMLIRPDWDTSPIRFAAIPLGIATGLGSLVLQLRALTNPSIGWRGLAPEFSMLLLGAAAGAMPWSNVGFAFSTAWQYPHGTAYSLLFLVAGLVFLITGRADKPSVSRAIFLLLIGLCAIALATVFDTLPPSVGSPSFRIHATSRLCGLWFAYGCGIATTIFAALQLRGALAAKSKGN